MVCDLIQRSTYFHLHQYMQDVRLNTQAAARAVQIVVIGNKAGREQRRLVSVKKAQQRTEQHGVDSWQTSCLTGIKLNEDNDTTNTEALRVRPFQHTKHDEGHTYICHTERQS